MTLSFRHIFPNTLTALMLAGLAYIAVHAAIVQHDINFAGMLFMYALSAYFTVQAVRMPTMRDGSHMPAVYLDIGLATLCAAAPLLYTIAISPAGLPILATPFGLCVAFVFAPWFVWENW